MEEAAHASFPIGCPRLDEQFAGSQWSAVRKGERESWGRLRKPGTVGSGACKTLHGLLRRKNCSLQLNKTIAMQSTHSCKGRLQRCWECCNAFAIGFAICKNCRGNAVRFTPGGGIAHRACNFGGQPGRCVAKAAQKTHLPPPPTWCVYSCARSSHR